MINIQNVNFTVVRRLYGVPTENPNVGSAGGPAPFSGMYTITRSYTTSISTGTTSYMSYTTSIGICTTSYISYAMFFQLLRPFCLTLPRC